MPASSFLSPPSALRRRRANRLTATRAVREAIVSLAGLLGSPVGNQAGEDVGVLVDVVARLHGPAAYPPVTGLVVRVGRRRAFLSADAIAHLAHRKVTLRTARVDLLEFRRRPGEVLLARDVLDHQLVDVDGVQVIRAADLYLAPVGKHVRLVGVDVSLQSLLRRLGPKRLRGVPTPERVIDWAVIAPFGDQVTGPSTVRLRAPQEELRRLRPSELADLLEDLGRQERQRLLEVLEPARAADALEEMEPGKLETLLREADPARAAALVAAMEPDEAVEALRDLSAEERDELLAAMPPETSAQLTRLLGYDERTAGGVMTSRLVVLTADSTVTQARAALAAEAEHHGEIDAVVVVTADGDLLADIPLFDLVIASDDTRLEEVLATPGHEHEPLTVPADTPVGDIAARLVDSRSSSLLVADARGRPVGRILADDVLDAILPERGRLHFPRLLQ